MSLALHLAGFSCPKGSILVRLLEDRFWNRVRVTGETQCWEWTGSRNRDGYGMFGRVDGKNVYTHRLAWALVHGPIPEGMTIDHLCLNKSCCNPRHLEVVTKSVNSSRGGRLGAVRRWG